MAGEEFSLENGRKVNKSQINGESLKSKLSQNDKYQKIFSLFDANNDGKLDENEVETFFEKMKSFASKGKESVFESSEAEEFLKEIKDSSGKSLADNGVKVGDLFGFVANDSDKSSFDPVKQAKQLINSGKMNGNTYSSEELKNTATSELSQDVSDAIKMFLAQKESQGSVSDFYNFLKEKFGSDEAASNIYAKLKEEELGAILLEKAKNLDLTEKDYWAEKSNLAKELYKTTGNELYNTQAQEFEARANSVQGKVVTRQITEKVQTGLKRDNASDKAVSASATYKTVTKNIKTILYPPMTFEKVFQEERGVIYNEDAIENYDRKKAETQVLVEMNNTLEDVKAQIARVTSYNEAATVKAPNQPNYELSRGRSTEYMMDSTRVDELESGVYLVYKRLFGSDENINAVLKRIGVDSTVSSTGRMSNANQAGKALVKYLESNFKAACGDKTFEQHQKETTEAYKKAYGDKNSIDIANAFIQSQQEGVQGVKTSVTAAGMVVMIAGQFIPAGSITSSFVVGAGLTAATVGGSAISATEAVTKKGGITQEDKSEILKELSTSVALTATGMGIGKVSSAMYGQLILKNCPMLLAKVSEIGADATMSMISTALITGDIDLKAEGLSQLIPVLTGLLKTKGNLKKYLVDDFKNTSAARGTKEKLSDSVSEKSQNINDQATPSEKVSTSEKPVEAQGKVSDNAKAKEEVAPKRTREEIQQELTDVMQNLGYRDFELTIIQSSSKADYETILGLLKRPEFKKVKFSADVLRRINKDNIDLINKLIDKKYYKKYESEFDYMTSSLLSATNKNSLPFINKMIDDGVLNPETSTDIWKMMTFTNENKARVKYVNELYDTEKDFFHSHMGYSVDPELKDLYESQFSLISDKNIDFAIDLLHSRRGKFDDSMLEDYVNILKLSDKRGYSRLNIEEKNTLLATIQKMSDADKAIFKKHGLSIEAITKTLSDAKLSIEVPKAQQQKFLTKVLANNNPKADKVFKEFDFGQYGKDGLPLKYSRKDFIDNVDDILMDLPDADRLEILSHYGIENGKFDGLLNNKPFENLSGYSTEFQNAAKKVQAEIDKFTTNNEVSIPDKEVKEILDGLIKGLPEFTSIVGKQQHKTHAYTVDIHMLKVLQDAMNDPAYSKLSDKSKTVLKFSAILHDIGKATGVVDPNHFRTSATYLSSILDKFNLPTEMKHQIIDTVDNHHWFSAFNTGKISAEDVAAKCRRTGDLDVYKILAKSDLANVSSTFHYRITETSNKAEYDAKVDAKMAEVDVAMKKLNNTAPVVFDSKIIGKGKKFPTKTVVKNGVEYKVKVLNLAELPDGMPLEKYGFVSGTTKENATFGVHFSDSPKESYDVITSDTRRLAQGHPIFSYMLLKWGHAGRIAQDGLIFDVDNANMVIAAPKNSVSGFKKQLKDDSSKLFDDYYSDRKGISTLIIQNIKENSGITLSRDEYATICEQYLKSKKHLSQIKDDIKLGENRVIKAEDLKSAVTKAQQSLFKNNKSDEVDGTYIDNNELTTVDPVPTGLYSTKRRIEDCSPEFLKLAEEKGLPIILNPATKAWEVGESVEPIHVASQTSGILPSFLNSSTKISKQEATDYMKQFTLKEVDTGRVVQRFSDDAIAKMVECVQKYPKEFNSLANKLTVDNNGNMIPRFSAREIDVLAPLMNKYPKRMEKLMNMTTVDDAGLTVPKFSAIDLIVILQNPKKYKSIISGKE